MAAFNPKWMDSNVVAIARGLLSGAIPIEHMPILADALIDAGCGRNDILMACHAGEIAIPVPITEALNRIDFDAKSELDDFAAARVLGCGIHGNVWSQAHLETRITRRRPRGSGSRADLARRLGVALQALSDRRWARICKGQRRATPGQLAKLAEEVYDAISICEGQSRERTLSVVDVFRAARLADRDGRALLDGGRISCHSYPYKWSTTTARSAREPDGSIVVILNRTNVMTIRAKASHWKTDFVPS